MAASAEASATVDAAAPPTAGALQGAWTVGASARLALVALERSGGGEAEARIGAGARADLPLLLHGPWVVALSMGYLYVRSEGGTGKVEVRTGYHLVDLRAEAGVELGSLLRGVNLRPYLCGGALLVGTRAKLQAFESRESAFGIQPGGVYGGGLRSRTGRLVLTLEVLGHRRKGSKDDLVAGLGVGTTF